MIVAIEIQPSIIKLGYSHLGEYIEDSTSFVPPISQRALVSSLADNIIKSAGNHIDAIGVVASGQIDISQGKLRSLLGLKYKNIKIISGLKKYFDCPIVLDSNPKMAAFAELKLSKYQELIYIDIGRYNIEAGTATKSIQNNVVAKKINVGQHIVLAENANHQTFDDYFYELFDENNIDEELLLSLGSKDWQLIAQRLAIGINNIICISSPNQILIGGLFGNYYKKYSKFLLNQLVKFDLPAPMPNIAKPKYPNSALVGAMHLATEHLQ